MGRRVSTARIGGLLKESLISKRDLGAHLHFAFICSSIPFADFISPHRAADSSFVAPLEPTLEQQTRLLPSWRASGTNLKQRRPAMNDVELMRLFVMLRRPIPWDPIPWWIKLNKEQIAHFNEVQQRLNTKIAEIEAQKIKELDEIAGLMK
jgi:hypothetical protein